MIMDKSEVEGLSWRECFNMLIAFRKYMKCRHLWADSLLWIKPLSEYQMDEFKSIAFPFNNESSRIAIFDIIYNDLMENSTII